MPQSPAVIDGVDGLSGWRELGREWSEDPTSSCGSFGPTTAGSTLAVVATCDGQDVIHVDLTDHPMPDEPSSGDTRIRSRSVAWCDGWSGWSQSSS
jgi:hypothetical protein